MSTEIMGRESTAWPGSLSCRDVSYFLPSGGQMSQWFLSSCSYLMGILERTPISRNIWAGEGA